MPRESTKTVKQEVKYLKKGGAPKALIKHEEREAKTHKVTVNTKNGGTRTTYR
jgi:hypothetical protein